MSIETSDSVSMNSQNVEDLEFEEAMKEMDDIIVNLESGKIKLKSAVYYYSRGQALYKHCKDLLDRAQTEVQNVVGDQDRDKDKI